jgi:hypothetical protein
MNRPAACLLLSTLFSSLLLSACSDPPVGSTPSAPKPVELQIIDDAATSVVVRWKPADDSASVTSYLIAWKGTLQGDSSQMSVEAGARSLRIDNLVVGQDYVFYAFAIRDELPSTPAIVTRAGIRAPSPPTIVSVSSINAEVIEVRWSGSDTGISAYRIDWKGATGLDSGNAEFDTTVTSFQIATARPCQSYQIDVRAIRQGLSSAPASATHMHAPGGPVPPPPAGLAAASRGPGSIALRWVRPNVSGITGFRLHWSRSSGGPADSLTLDMTASAVIENLAPGEPYRLSVSTLAGCTSSEPRTIEWATAARFTTDATLPVSIRMYENTSSKGSGLVLDPDKGGPRNVSVGASNPALENVQLAIFANQPSAPPDGFLIGPAYAFPGYRNVDRFDSTVYISESTYRASTFNDWYMGVPLDQTIARDGNVRAYGIPNVIPELFGQGFVVRLRGGDGQTHYARVFIRNIGGAMLQGTAPDRYVELEISYQRTPNLPFAKPSGRSPSPPGVMARKLP